MSYGRIGMRSRRRGLGFMSAVLLPGSVLAVAGCGAQTRTVTKVVTETVTNTVTAEQKPPSARTAPAAASFPNELQLGTLFARALQQAVGSRYEISEDATSCNQNVDPGSYQCDSNDNAGDTATYNVSARDGRWTGTIDPSQSAPPPSSPSGPGVPPGYPTTVGGSY
jgi:hypothetical protein